jgi:hypothetical protein
VIIPTLRATRHASIHYQFPLVLALVLVVGSSRPAAAAELQARTSQAYDAYLTRARQAFLLRTKRPLTEKSATSSGDLVVDARPANGDGILDVPGGLVHHWLGTTFIAGVSLREAVDLSHAYAEYTAVYTSIIRSELLEQNGDTYRVLLRLKEGEAGVSAVLQMRSTVQYFADRPGTMYAISDADEIREVRDAGRAGERLLPAGRDSGYLWRASTFSCFVEERGGVYIETETLGLSREFPPLLGWLIEPIARRLGRKSVELSLKEFAAAVRAAHARLQPERKP